MKRLADKTAIVTGGGGGIGGAISRLLAEEGARVALFLVSDDSSFMTGSDFLIDGGYAAQ